MQQLYFWKSTAQFQHIYVLSFFNFSTAKCFVGHDLEGHVLTVWKHERNKNPFLQFSICFVYVLEIQLLCFYRPTKVHELAHNHQ